MNYRHSFHAGNFADVLKHTALVGLLLHLRKKEKPFAVIDTHGGSGLYDLGGEAAARTGEAKEGIGRLRGQAGLPDLLATYCDFVGGFGEGFYPGSPLIAARLLRAQDRLVAIEKHPEDYELLRQALADKPNTQAMQGDAYKELPRLLPPPERRGLVLIDPPYEAPDEFARATKALIEAHRRFSTGIYALWYPAKSQGPVMAAIGEARHAGLQKMLRLELDVGSLPAATGRLTAAGLLIVNAPFGLADAMAPVVVYLAEKLAQGPGAKGLCRAMDDE
jgi:23S rRNA (adenine2030-N6)-methyltransferase